jgi:hypothetical protein
MGLMCVAWWCAWKLPAIVRALVKILYREAFAWPDRRLVAASVGAEMAAAGEVSAR